MMEPCRRCDWLTHLYERRCRVCGWDRWNLTHAGQPGDWSTLDELQP